MLIAVLPHANSFWVFFSLHCFFQKSFLSDSSSFSNFMHKRVHSESMRRSNSNTVLHVICVYHLDGSLSFCVPSVLFLSEIQTTYFCLTVHTSHATPTHTWIKKINFNSQETSTNSLFCLDFFCSVWCPKNQTEQWNIFWLLVWPRHQIKYTHLSKRNEPCETTETFFYESSEA